VCQEVKTYNSDEFFAATPMTETMKMILSLAAEHHKKQVVLVDISRAYFNAVIDRKVFVELPPEAGYSKQHVGELVKCMYGTRDAAQGWERTYCAALEAMGFRRGTANPCIFNHGQRGINLTVHGDDFFAEAAAAELDWFEAELMKKFEGKVKGRLRQEGDELRILNRVVRRTARGYEWEADQRHAELIIAGVGLAPDSKPLMAPGRRLTSKELSADDEEELAAEEASKYRAIVARANFLAGDRPDIGYAVKELCRGMAKPTSRHASALKRLARYLVGRPRVVLHFEWQSAPATLDVYSDSDWAGCAVTRRSTTGGVLMRGSHVLKCWCTTQSTVALSSAEAELIAAVRGAAEGLAARTWSGDFGRECGLRMYVDSSAALGIMRRSGVGKVRHLDTRLLWIQERVQAGDLSVMKVAGEDNPADLMTKYLGEDAMFRNLSRMGCWPREGRAQSAPQLQFLFCRPLVSGFPMGVGPDEVGPKEG
jgi:hypothetical protein